MNKHWKAILVLAVAQVTCLACGLWVRDQFLLATVQWKIKSRVAASEPNTAQPGRAAPQPAEHQTGSSPEVDSSASGLEEVQAVMPLVSVLSLVWIGGLQIIVAYLVLTRLLNESSRNQERSRMRLLSREKDLVRTRNAVIFGLAKLAEHRDKETGQHLERIALFATCLATALRRDSRFRDSISPTFVKTIGISSVLHDIGKVGLPDSILCKQGPLTVGERSQMEHHTAIGAECIRQIEQRLGNCNFLQMARQIAKHHHERWDGTGYPTGLAGREIPLAARVVAVVDVYDALVSKRCYKAAIPHEECVSIIKESAGSHLDPAIIEIFLRIENQFWEIASRYMDRSPSVAEQARAKHPPKDPGVDDKLISSILDQNDTPVLDAAGSL